MKILLDPQIFNAQVYGGISRYYTEVFSELNKDKKAVIEIPISFSKNEYLKISSLYNNQQKRYSSLVNLMSKLGISTRKMTKKRNQKKTIEALKKQDFDLFIPTYYDPYFLEFIGDKPFVLTVYDMIHELFPQYFSDGKEIVANKKLLMHKATKIIAVSQNTKKDIIKIYPDIDASKIEVIYHGNSIKVNDNKTISLPENYILFVGVRDNYKNFNFLLESIVDLFRADPTLELVCAGGGKFKKEELEFIRSLNLENRISQRNFNEDELGLFYKNAKCFVFPSMYEGFGIPVLESMACGCPIVLTNNSSFPEVAGEAGIFYELDNKTDLKTKIESVLHNENLREEYSQKGLKQVQKFNWEDASQRCYDLYSNALETKK